MVAILIRPIEPVPSAGVMTSRCLLVLTALIVSAALPSPVSAAAIRVVSPSTGIFFGNVLAGQTIFQDASEGPTEVSARVNPVEVFFSPTTNTLFGLAVPYVEKRLRISGVGETTTRGLGDVTVIGHYRFFNRTGKGYADMAAARIGIELPTGSTERGVRLEVPEPVRRKLQPGSGSTDLAFTLAAGREHYRYNVNFDAGYRLNTEHDAFRFGDQAFADLGFEPFLFPQWTRPRGFELLGVLEFDFLHQERDQLAGKGVASSGGDSLFIAPGVQWIATERVLFEASLQLPLAQDLNGTQPELDHNLLVGFRFVF